MVAVDGTHDTSFREMTTTLRSLIRLQQRPFLGLLVNPFGTTARVIQLEGHHLRITRLGKTTSMSLQAHPAPPVVRKGAFGTILTISSGEHDDIILKGAAHIDARAFSDGVKEAWISFNLTAFEEEAGRFERIHAAGAALIRPTRYPAACSMAPLLIDARRLDATLLSKLQSQAIGPDKTQRVAQVRKFVADTGAARTAAISTFVAAELVRWKEFFDTIESKPLTSEQRLSVVVDEDATLGVRGHDGRIWYRCEHLQHCGNLLPACLSCATALPRHADGSTEVRCACGSSYPSCPECEDGWLVERTGTYGSFLGCVRYPTCVGKAKIPPVAGAAGKSKPHR